jgi:hypothetical protein
MIKKIWSSVIISSIKVDKFFIGLVINTFVFLATRKTSDAR